MQVSSLNKDMEKLKMTGKKDGEEEKKIPGAGMSNERKKELKRMNSKKRSSKQGEQFINIKDNHHFLFNDFSYFLSFLFSAASL